MTASTAQQFRANSIWEMRSIEEALTSLERLPELPSVESFICILQKCRQKKEVVYAKRLRAYMCKSGLGAHASLGNYLVPMLVECESVCDAVQVFSRLVHRNEYSWTSLITGHIKCGKLQHALNLYKQMKEDRADPSKYTFLAVLKACAWLKDAERGQKVHAEISEKGLEKDPFVGSSLIDMYAKCGWLAKAQEVFDRLPFRVVVSWNALLAGYAEHGFGEEALNCFQQIRRDGVSPDAVTFVCSLKACCSIRAIDKGRDIHAEIARKELESSPFVGNTLVDMYAKCGSLAKAWEVFDKLPVRDVVSWNALIIGYAEHGLGKEALNCFKQMQLAGVTLDAVSFVCSLKACSSIGALDKGQDIHAEIARKGLETDPYVGNTLVDMYAKCGALASAREVFYELPVRDVVSWNTLIAGCVECGSGEEALNCFKEMKPVGVSPSAVTFVCCLKACGSIGAIDQGQEVHTEIARWGFDKRPFVGSTLVDMYAKCGLLVKAQEVFDVLPVQDVASWNALIAGYAEHGLGEEALNCFEQMKLEGVSRDTVTFMGSLKACGSIGATEKGQEIHAEIATNELESDTCVGSTLVDMYSKCGSLAKAQEVFDKLPVRNVVLWTALIAGYAKLGKNEIVFSMLEKMRTESIKPDQVTFLSILTVCSHAGIVDNGQKYFDAMSKDYGIAPAIGHYICMVDVLGRAGQLAEAVAMVDKMPFQPNLLMWHTVLGACQKWGNVELGKHAFEHAMRLDEKDDAAYVLMSNIYADAHMKEDEKKVDAMRKRTNMKPGQC